MGDLSFLKKVKDKVNYWTTPLYERIPEWCFPEHPRRFHAYGVGMGKTGTVTLHIMFSKHYRTAHEPEQRFLVNKIVVLSKGISD